MIEDVFNPAGGYFVTAEYDQTVWERLDRLASHSIVRCGSITESETGRALEPVLFVGSRVDFERDGQVLEGRLPVADFLAQVERLRRFRDAEGTIRRNMADTISMLERIAGISNGTRTRRSAANGVAPRSRAASS